MGPNKGSGPIVLRAVQTSNRVPLPKRAQKFRILTRSAVLRLGSADLCGPARVLQGVLKSRLGPLVPLINSSSSLPVPPACRGTAVQCRAGDAGREREKRGRGTLGGGGEKRRSRG